VFAQAQAAAAEGPGEPPSTKADTGPYKAKSRIKQAADQMDVQRRTDPVFAQAQAAAAGQGTSSAIRGTAGPDGGAASTSSWPAWASTSTDGWRATARTRWASADTARSTGRGG
jgi:hypothetical protein